MRVVHLISGGDTGGAKTHVLSLIKSLDSEISVQLVCLVRGPFFEEANELGISTVLLEQKGRWDLGVVGQLTRILKDFDADILHCHGARANFLAALVRFRLNISTVTTIHSDYRRDFEDNLYKQLLYSNLNSLSLRFFDYYIAVTERFRELLLSRGFKPERVFTVYNGLDFDSILNVDPERFRAAHGIPKTAPIIGTIGRLVRVKRQDVFLKAGAQLMEHHPDAHLVVVGDGDELEPLKALAVELGIYSQVHFTKHLKEPEHALSTFTINVLSSESETFPYALLEGARRRIPTVSTPVGGIPDLILPGETGILTPPGDSERLAGALRDLLDNSEYREQLASQLYQHARANFSLRAMRDQQIALYQKMICPPKQIVVSGYFGFGNTGDEALLSGLVSGLRNKNDNLEITVLSRRPQKTAKLHRVKAKQRFSIRDVWRALKGADLFISGGGTLLQDETSLRSILYYSSLIHLARARGAKVMIFANGLGPLHTNIGRWLARSALNSAHAITLRDHQSAQTAKRLFWPKDPPAIEITSDPAFSLEPASDERVDQVLSAHAIPKDRPLAIISLRPWAQATGNIINLASDAAAFIEESGYFPVFVAMQTEKDQQICELAARKFGGQTAVIASGSQPDLTLAILARAEFTLGMRLHALILSAAGGVLPIGLSYDPKIDGFLDEIGAPCLGRVEDLTSDLIRESLGSEILPHLDTWRGKIRAITHQMKKKADRNSEIAQALLGN